MIDFTVLCHPPVKSCGPASVNDGDLGSQGGGGNAVMEGAHAYGTGWIEYVGGMKSQRFTRSRLAPEASSTNGNYTDKSGRFRAGKLPKRVQRSCLILIWLMRQAGMRLFLRWQP